MTDNIIPLLISANGRIKQGVSDRSLGCGFKLNIEDGENPFKDKVFLVNEVTRHIKKDFSGECVAVKSV